MFNKPLVNLLPDSIESLNWIVSDHIKN